MTDEAMNTILDELRILRQRNEELSQSLEYCRIENETLKEMLQSCEMENRHLRMQLEGVSSDSSDDSSSELLSRIIQHKRDMIERFSQLLLDGVEDSEKQSMYENLRCCAEADIIVCESMQSIDYNNRASVVDSLQRITKAMMDAPEPEFNEFYSKILQDMPEENQRLEVLYSGVIDRVQELMFQLRDQL